MKANASLRCFAALAPLQQNSPFAPLTFVRVAVWLILLRARMQWHEPKSKLFVHALHPHFAFIKKSSSCFEGRAYTRVTTLLHSLLAQKGLPQQVQEPEKLRYPDTITCADPVTAYLKEQTLWTN